MEEMKKFMETEFECVLKEKIKERAEQFEHSMITWMPYQICQWWGFKPDMVANHKISKTHPVGYGKLLQELVTIILTKNNNGHYSPKFNCTCFTGFFLEEI